MTDKINEEIVEKSTIPVEIELFALTQVFIDSENNDMRISTYLEDTLENAKDFAEAIIEDISDEKAVWNAISKVDSDIVIRFKANDDYDNFTDCFFKISKHVFSSYADIETKFKVKAKFNKDFSKSEYY